MVRRPEHCVARKRQWLSSLTSKTKKYVTGGGNGRGIFVFVQMRSELHRHTQDREGNVRRQRVKRRLILGISINQLGRRSWEVSLACRLYIAEISLDVCDFVWNFEGKPPDGIV